MKKLIALGAGLAFTAAVLPAFALISSTFPTVGCALNVSNNFVQSGQTVTLSWDGTGETNLAISKQIGTQTPTLIEATTSMSSSLDVVVNSSATYILAFTGVNGSATCSRMVRIPNGGGGH